MKSEINNIICLSIFPLSYNNSNHVPGISKIIKNELQISDFEECLNEGEVSWGGWQALHKLKGKWDSEGWQHVGLRSAFIARGRVRRGAANPSGHPMEKRLELRRSFIINIVLFFFVAIDSIVAAHPTQIILPPTSRPAEPLHLRASASVSLINGVGSRERVCVGYGRESICQHPL